MARSGVEIRFQSMGHYRGVDLFAVMGAGAVFYVAWMDKFYQADSLNVLYVLVDAWWTLRMN